MRRIFISTLVTSCAIGLPHPSAAIIKVGAALDTHHIEAPIVVEAATFPTQRKTSRALIPPLDLSADMMGQRLPIDHPPAKDGHNADPLIIPPLLKNASSDSIVPKSAPPSPVMSGVASIAPPTYHKDLPLEPMTAPLTGKRPSKGHKRGKTSDMSKFPLAELGRTPLITTPKPVPIPPSTPRGDLSVVEEHIKHIKKNSHSTIQTDNTESSGGQKYRRILSLDGGGIRGILEIGILQHLEDLTGKPVLELFDLFAGTSTGGIIALGIASGVPLKEIAQLYEQHGPDIFTKRCPLKWGANYDHHPLEKLCAQYFGDKTLRDLKKDVAIPAFDFENEQLKVFTKRTALINPKDNFKLADIARATSAAPTYFKPKKIINTYGDEIALIDGGLAANSPTLIALTETALTYNVGLNEMRVVSLGTGHVTTGQYSYNDLKNAGVLKWARPIIHWSTNGVYDIDYALSRILNGQSPEKYYRINIPIDSTMREMDNVDPENIRKLKSAVTTFKNADENARRLGHIAAMLSPDESNDSSSKGIEALEESRTEKRRNTLEQSKSIDTIARTLNTFAETLSQTGASTDRINPKHLETLQATIDAFKGTQSIGTMLGTLSEILSDMMPHASSISLAKPL